MEEAPGDPTTVWLWAAGDDAELPYDALSEDEEDNARRLASAAVRAGYLQGHALLRLALAHHTGQPADELRYQRRCGWCGDPRHGRPTLVGDRPLHFSLTWRSTLPLVAIGEVDVGVDAERSGRQGVPTGHQVAAPHEIEQLEGAFGRPLSQEMLLRWWTAKEALGKARGSGLVGVNRLELVASGVDSWAPVIDSQAVWHLKSLLVEPGRWASVACRRRFVLCWKRRPHG